MKYFKFLILIFAYLQLTNSLKQCATTPRWTLSGKKFPTSFAKSQVKVLAFLKASCGFCQTQMARLIDLQNELNALNNLNVTIIVINSFDKDSYSKRKIFLDINANNTIQLVQDTNRLNIWDLYSVETDDMLVFDKYVFFFFKF